MYEFLLIIFLLISITLIVIIIVQQGKGSNMGASFGTGTSAHLFSPSGSGNFMTRVTSGLALIFFVLSLFLSNLSGQQKKNNSIWEKINSPVKNEHLDISRTTVASSKNVQHTTQ